MKITLEHREYIRAAIDIVLAENPDAVEMYQKGNFHRADRVKDLQRRFCFDLLYAARISTWVCHEIYSYADDTHLYTALKAVCPKVTREY